MSEQETFSFTPLSVEKPAPKKRPRSNLVIEAGAGTGKTTRIVKEVVQLLIQDPSIVLERIVLMTFTEKAAGEIADRIRAAITDLSTTLDSPEPRWPGDPALPAIITVSPDGVEAARAACEAHLPQIDRLRSQTIHSFCQSILRLYPIEAGLTPQFRIAEGYERGRLLHEIYGEWLESELSPGTSESRLTEWRMLYRHYLGLNRLEGTLTGLLPAADLMRDESLTLGDATAVDTKIREVVMGIKALSEQDVRQINDDLQAEVVQYVRSTALPDNSTSDGWINWLTPIESELSNMSLRKGRKPLKDLLRPLRGEKVEKSFLNRLRRHRIAEVLRSVAVRYFAFLEKAKEERGVVDFDDLLVRTARLLEDERILEEVRGRYDYIFVDEFQDTDRIQASIIDRLARDRRGMFVPGKVTLVGDPKQSIYAFRSADPETYRDTVSAFRSGDANHEYLHAQHRSDPILLDALNAMFGALFPDRPDDDPNVFTPVYSELEAARGKLLPDNEPRVRFVIVPPSEDTKSLEIEAEALASWIASRRTGEPGELRRLAVLMRRSTHFQLYVDALERRGVPSIMPPAGSFLDQPAVVDLTAVLRAVAHTFDRAAQISAARSPYFALTDDEIFSHWFGCTDRENDECPFSSFLRTIRHWRRHARHSGVLELIEKVLSETPVESLHTVSRHGALGRAHLDRVLELAATFDAEEAGSLAEFVDELAARRDQLAESEPSITDEGADAVRIMTVHGSKGLEFDTVILPDLAFSSRHEGLNVFATTDPKALVFSGNLESISAWAYQARDGEELRTVFSNRERAEEQRLFYVAVTRAKAELVFVAADGSTSGAGFMKHLHAVFGKPAITACLTSAETPETRTLTPLSGSGSIEARFECADVDEEGVDPSRFVDPRAESIVGAASAIVPFDPMQTDDSESSEGSPILDRARAARRAAGSANRQAGILLHRVMEVWNGDAATIDATVELLADETGAEAVDVEIVKRRVRQVVSSPVLKRITAMETLGAELTIHYIRDDRPREVRIDRLLRDEDGLVVLDYKSGKPDSDRLEIDREQVRGYCEIVTQSRSGPVRGLLWYIDMESDESIDVDM